MSGSAEIYEAAFSFDASWEGFARVAVLECAGERREQLLIGNRCIIPWEILHAGAYLRVGVYGVRGNAAMPTVYSERMHVAQGAEASAAAREHSADVFDQIVEIGQQAAQSAADADEAKTAAEAAQSAAETAQEAAEASADAAEGYRDEVAEMLNQMGNVPVVEGNSFAATGTGVTQTLARVNIKTGAESSETVPLPIANGQSAGLMTPEQVEAIEELESRVGGLENQNVRLSYTASGAPTAAEIRAFVVAAGYTDTGKWASIGVVVRASNHIWRYYDNTEAWEDIGLDTVQQASQSVKGIVQGSSTAGKVFVEADGTMSLNGYDALASGLANVQTGKADKATTYTKTEVDAALSGKQDTLTFDAAPTQSSTNAVTSGGVWNAINGERVLLYNDPTMGNVAAGTVLVAASAAIYDEYIVSCYQGADSVDTYLKRNSSALCLGYENTFISWRKITHTDAGGIVAGGAYYRGNSAGGPVANWCRPYKVYGIRH